MPSPPVTDCRRRHGRRLRLAILAGTVALVPNLALLDLAARLHVATGHGGLLKFVVIFLLRPLGARVPGLEPAGSLVKLAFHILVGLAMAVVFGEALFPYMARKGMRGWLDGWLYGILVWILTHKSV